MAGSLLNEYEVRFIRGVLKLYYNKLEQSDELIDINDDSNEENLIFCNILLRKKSLSRLEVEEWRFISDMLENYYELLREKEFNLGYTVDSDTKFEIWNSIAECNNLLNKIDYFI